MKKLKLVTTLSIGLIGGGLLTSIPLIAANCSCSPTPTPDEKTIEINNTNVAGYLTDSNSQIYYDGSSSYIAGNQLLKLKEFSEVNDNITHFVITSDINFGFLVDPDMDCHISASNGAIITCNGGLNSADGVFVGTTTDNCSGVYTKNLVIDSNVTFMISSPAHATGVYFNSTATNSTQIINGTFTISSTASFTEDYYSAYGVCFDSTASGSITVNGTFAISGCIAYGVTFADAATNSTQIINGIFTVIADSWVYGIVFNDTASGSNQTINGTFTISSTSGNASGVYFNSTASGSNQTINGTFTIKSASSSYSSYIYGVNFYSAFSGTTTIEGAFTIKSTNSNVCGVYFGYTTSGTLTMNGTQFFSNKAPSIYWNWPTTNNPNKPTWNDAVFTGNFISDSGGDLPGDNLSLTSISNKNPSPDFTIQVIGDTNIASSKAKFNGAYKKALDDYVKSDYCGSIAKKWLNVIIDAIPLS